MNLFELFDRAIPGYQDLEDDNSQNRTENIRKSRLTLLQINKIRMMNDIRNFERKEKEAVIQRQYGTPATEDSGF